MPFPIAEVIGAAATVGSGAINMQSAAKTNLRTRQHNEHMYQWQRKDALDDWNRVNEYNSPKAVMARLKAAGLNPAMVYGQGATGSNADPVRNTNMQGYHPETPKLDSGMIGASIQNALQLATMKTQKSILQQNLTNEQEKEKLIKAQVLDTLAGADSKTTGTSRAKIDLAIEEALKSDKEAGMRSQYQKTATEAELLRYEADEKQNFQNLAKEEQAKRIELLEKDIAARGYENEVRRLKAEMAKKGINPDASWTTEYWQQLRKFWKYLGNIGD